MSVTALNGVKVYNLASGKKLPAWLPEQKRRALLKEDEGYARRIQLLQDFDFSTASQDIKMSSDGMYIAACGAWPDSIANPSTQATPTLPSLRRVPASGESV